MKGQNVAIYIFVLIFKIHILMNELTAGNYLYHTIEFVGHTVYILCNIRGLGRNINL